MRQYKIFYKRAGAESFGTLQPNVHAGLYEKPEVAQAIEQMRTTPHIMGMSLKLEDEHFNVVSFDQEAEAPRSFKFVEPTPSPAPEIIGEDYVGTSVNL